MRWLLALLVQLAVVRQRRRAGHGALSVVRCGEGHPATELTGYLFKPSGTGPHAGRRCSCTAAAGLSRWRSATASCRARWTGPASSPRKAIAVLMVDSFTPRGSGEMCSRSGFKEWLYLRRPADAYGALAWLQQQPFVARDRVGDDRLVERRRRGAVRARQAPSAGRPPSPVPTSGPRRLLSRLVQRAAHGQPTGRRRFR